MEAEGLRKVHSSLLSAGNLQGAQDSEIPFWVTSSNASFITGFPKIIPLFMHCATAQSHISDWGLWEPTLRWPHTNCFTADRGRLLLLRSSNWIIVKEHKGLPTRGVTVEQDHAISTHRPLLCISSQTQDKPRGAVPSDQLDVRALAKHHGCLGNSYQISVYKYKLLNLAWVLKLASRQAPHHHQTKAQ